METRNATFRIDDERLKNLRKIALDKNCLHGGKPSITKLLHQIADGEFTLTRKKVSKRG